MIILGYPLFPYTVYALHEKFLKTSSYRFARSNYVQLYLQSSQAYKRNQLLNDIIDRQMIEKGKWRKPQEEV